MSPPPSASPELPEPPGDDRQWFASEVQPHEPALRTYLHRRFPHLPDVDDVVQESFLKTWLARQRGTLRSARGFLFTVAGNAAVSLFRRRRFVSPEPVNETDGPSAIVDDVDFLEQLCSRDELDLVASVLAELPERCRQVAMLRLLKGYDYDAIAAELKISPETVRVQMARSIKKCTESMRSRFPS